MKGASDHRFMSLLVHQTTTNNERDNKNDVFISILFLMLLPFFLIEEVLEYFIEFVLIPDMKLSVRSSRKNEERPPSTPLELNFQRNEGVPQIIGS